MDNTIIIASLLLFLNVILLCILVPGGPIENRDFSGLTGLVFWGFNVFLITLGVCSFITCYLLLISNPYAVIITQILAVSYFLVYGLDLGGIFPRSPTKMSKVLMLLEIINMCMATYLFIYVTAISKLIL